MTLDLDRHRRLVQRPLERQRDVDAGFVDLEPDTEYPVIATMLEQRDIVAGEGDRGGTMRLGRWEATLQPEAWATIPTIATPVPSPR